MRALVNSVPLDIICDLVGITIDIQSDGGMHLSEAAVELRHSKPYTFENVGTADEKKKKTAGGVFLTLLKKDPRVTPEMRRKVFKAPESEAKRQRKYTTSLIDAMSLAC